MLNSPRNSIPPIALGAASVVLAMISLALFLLPVLSIPIAISALVLAFAGLVGVRWRADESLRWSVAGMGASLLALSVGLAINYAPRGEEPRPDVPPLWQQPPVAPFVVPPSRPGFMETALADKAGDAPDR